MKYQVFKSAVKNLKLNLPMWIVLKHEPKDLHFIGTGEIQWAAVTNPKNGERYYKLFGPHDQIFNYLKSQILVDVGVASGQDFHSDQTVDNYISKYGWIETDMGPKRNEGETWGDYIARLREDPKQLEATPGVDFEIIKFDS